jgi:ABC-2 type transport system permease protein
VTEVAATEVAVLEVAVPDIAVQAIPLVRWRSAGSFFAIVARDARVLRKDIWQFVGRVVTYPLLFVFVFTYVLPRIGVGQFLARPGTVSFGTILLPGLIAVTAVSTGFASVTQPLSVEFGATREIEDRVMSPLPLWAIALEKILFGAFQAALSGVLVFPLAYFIPAAAVSVHIHSWPTLITVLLLTSLVAGSMGLAFGCLFRPEHLGILFGLVLIVLTFMGCVYYPWARLHDIRWVQYLVLANPVVYLSEGMRAALTPGIPHMPPAIFIPASIAWVGFLTWTSLRLFVRRIVS